MACRRFLKLAPAFLLMLVLVAVVLALLPEQTLVELLGSDSGPFGVLTGAAIGSVSIMPGFIAFPLAGILRSRGASYAALAAFSTALMMVGIVTFPVERRYLGTPVSVLRNLVSLAIALAVSVAMGFAYGEW